MENAGIWMLFTNYPFSHYQAYLYFWWLVFIGPSRLKFLRLRGCGPSSSAADRWHRGPQSLGHPAGPRSEAPQVVNYIQTSRGNSGSVVEPDKETSQVSLRIFLWSWRFMNEGRAATLKRVTFRLWKVPTLCKIIIFALLWKYILFVLLLILILSLTHTKTRSLFLSPGHRSSHAEKQELIQRLMSGVKWTGPSTKCYRCIIFYK